MSEALGSGHKKMCWSRGLIPRFLRVVKLPELIREQQSHF
jgi:hypothetical protein